MRYKKFKNAEIEVSQLAVGTWAIGGQNYGKVDKNEAIYAIRRMMRKWSKSYRYSTLLWEWNFRKNCRRSFKRNTKGTGVNFHKVRLDSGHLYTWV